VRDIYELPDSSDLLFVTTDRVSCFDVVSPLRLHTTGTR
jgi:phosphoribosylaminoimidazole-succinocarboxamide synthase